jgi:hypothetical protein
MRAGQVVDGQELLKSNGEPLKGKEELCLRKDILLPQGKKKKESMHNNARAAVINVLKPPKLT